MRKHTGWLATAVLAGGFLSVGGSGDPFGTGSAHAADARFTTGSSDVLIKEIDDRIRQNWTDNGVEPSAPADDAEWVRRLYLDLLGHVPPADVLEAFLADKDPAKRTKLIDRLLDDPAYVRNWTTIWTNLTIGRQTPRRVSRTGMQKFFREAFGQNRPWNEVVYDILSAEGHFEQNGAVNYLLAQMQMNDEGVQATAKTARLFLGLQVQCTQCHNHPFNDWKQNQFWEYNAFFRQLRRVDHRKYDPKTGRTVDDYTELVQGDFAGPVYYEKRNGLMQVAFPKYEGTEVDKGDGVNRRLEFAKLVAQGDKPQLAAAYVNRMWGHFFGYGFTRPVDDLGPHNPPSHPDLFDRLTKEFVKSRYDSKQLIRWIANSEAYNLTSRTTEKNVQDNPAAGETPLFSHVYVKSMEAEQLFDSLIVATNAHKTGRSSWEQAEQQRETWLRQFSLAFNTDENDEATTFNGTIPQALMLMNGELVRNATDGQAGSYLHRVLQDPGNDTAKVKKLFLATLGRDATPGEIAALNKIAKNLKTPDDKLALYQDLFWALLNSNEFIFVH